MGIIQYMRNCEKLAQLSALTLNNLSTASSAKSIIKEYESELIVIGFSDDSLAGIIASILADLASSWIQHIKWYCYITINNLLNNLINEIMIC